LFEIAIQNIEAARVGAAKFQNRVRRAAPERLVFTGARHRVPVIFHPPRSQNQRVLVVWISTGGACSNRSSAFHTFLVAVGDFLPSFGSVTRNVVQNVQTIFFLFVFLDLVHGSLRA
jgi:hypothetical protein